MWNEDNDDILNFYSELIINNFNKKSKCLICNDKDIHIYFHKFDNKHAGIWLWCSKCHTFIHMYGVAPLWWENPTFINEDLLNSEPDYLDTKKDEIDKWLACLLYKYNGKNQS